MPARGHDCAVKRTETPRLMEDSYLRKGIQKSLSVSGEWDRGDIERHSTCGPGGLEIPALTARANSIGY